MKIFLIAALLLVLLGQVQVAQASQAPVGLIFHSDHWFLREVGPAVSFSLNSSGIPTVVLDDGSAALWTRARRQGIDPGSVFLIGSNPFQYLQRVAYVEIHAFGTRGYRPGYYRIEIHDRRGGGLSVASREGWLAIYHPSGRQPLLDELLSKGVAGQLTAILSSMLR